jgi:glycoside/pentoside/hexuronide:cation symporter, GPH family
MTAMDPTDSASKASASDVVRASLRVKLLYGLGEVANTTKTVLFGLFTLFLYTTVMGLPGTLVGIAAAVGLVADAFLDPYIGYISDKAHFRLGRRHSFMLIGALTMGITLWMFFSPPRGLSREALFVWLLVSGTLVRVTTSLFNIPYFALGAEMSRDYEERTNIAAVRGGLALIGTLLTAALSFVVFFPNRLAGVDPKLDYAGYPAMGLAFGVMITVFALVSLVATLPWRRVQGDANPAHLVTSHSFVAGFAQSMRNRSFRPVLFSASLFYCAVAVNSAVTVHFLSYGAQVTASTILSSFQLAFYAGGLGGVVFWLGLIRRLAVDKRPLYLAGTIATGLLALAGYLLIGEGRAFGVSNAPPILIGYALAGFFGSVVLFIPASMLADVADDDELATGQRREGAFFGLFFFGQKLAAGIAVLAAGVLIDSFAGLVPGQAQQSSLTVQRVGLIYGALPALMLFLAAGLMSRRTLNKSTVMAIQEELSRRRLGERSVGRGV